MSSVLVVAAVVCVSLISTASGVVVTFPDANLEVKVRNELGIPAPTAITDTDMATMWILSASNSFISNIDGLEYGTNLTWVHLYNNQISDMSAVGGLTSLAHLNLGNNQISDMSAVGGLTNLISLGLNGNRIVILDLAGSNLASLLDFDIAGNPLTDVMLAGAALSYRTFNVLMNDGNSAYTGIAEVPGVVSLDMSGVDFVGITHLSRMHTMDDLETLLLAGATNLDSGELVTLLGELDSLDLLDVTDLWYELDLDSQGSLIAWHNIAGNTLVGFVLNPGDANGDGSVDLQDFSVLKANFGTTTGAIWEEGDFNGDGAIDLQDFSLLKANFGTGVETVPEPATLMLLLASGALTLLRRKRRATSRSRRQP